MKILVIVVAILLSACQSQQEKEQQVQLEKARTEESLRYIKRREDEAEQSGKNCLARKGIIVRSSWDGRIVDCK